MSLFKEFFQTWWMALDKTPGTMAMFISMIALGVAMASTEWAKRRRANNRLFRLIARQWGNLRKS